MLGHIKVNQFAAWACALWEGFWVFLSVGNFLDKAGKICWVSQGLWKDFESLGIREDLLELGFEHVFFSHNLGKDFIGDFFESLDILYFFRKWFLIPVFVLFEPADNGWEAFLFVMEVLPEICDSVFELGDSFMEEGFVFDAELLFHEQ